MKTVFSILAFSIVIGAEAVAARPLEVKVTRSNAHHGSIFVDEVFGFCQVYNCKDKKIRLSFRLENPVEGSGLVNVIFKATVDMPRSRMTFESTLAMAPTYINNGRGAELLAEIEIPNPKTNKKIKKFVKILIPDIYRQSEAMLIYNRHAVIAGYLEM